MVTKNEGIFNKKIFENSKKAFDTDAGILANEMGLDFNVVKESLLFQKAFKTYLHKIRKKYPDKISSFYFERVPEQKAHLQFVGEIPTDVLIPIEKNNQGDKIIITDGGKFSIQENQDRAREVANRISKILKQGTLEVYFSNSKQKIIVDIQQPYGFKGILNGTKILSENNLFELIKNELKTINKEQIHFNISENLEQTYTLDASRGGSWLFKNDGPNSYISACTSGWSVIVPGFGLAVLTAGHCMDGVNGSLSQIRDHKTNIDYSLVPGNFVFGLKGDVGFMTTPNTREKYEFHARENEIRYVWDRKLISDMTERTPTLEGEAVCFYGRASNYRTCNHFVLNTKATKAGGNPTKLIGSLVMVTNDGKHITGGDSGGGWSFGNLAFGVHHGRIIGTRAFFTPVEQAEKIFGLEIF